MGKNQDPGSGIDIPDPQHWLRVYDKGLFTTSSEKIQKRIQIAQVYIAFQVKVPTDYLHVPYKVMFSTVHKKNN